MDKDQEAGSADQLKASLLPSLLNDTTLYVAGYDDLYDRASEHNNEAPEQ